MPRRSRLLAPRLRLTGLSLLACAVLVSAACQSESKATFFDPSRSHADGGQFLPRHGRDDGGVGGGPDGGPKPPPRPVFDQVGDPMIFDPAQVYVHGRFLGGNMGNNAYGLFCADGGTSGFADWSSKGDWKNPNDDGTTVALPCETRDARVRLDGSIVVEFAHKAVRLFVQDSHSIDGRNITIPVSPEVGPTGDPEILLCGKNNFRHWLSPEDGMVVGFCLAGDGTVAYNLANAGVDALEIPAEFRPAHIGYGNHVLLNGMGQPKKVGVWSPDDGLVELKDLLPFAFEQVGAIRAQEDGFTLLVVDRDDDPPRVSGWHVSHAGKLTEGPTYPTLEGMNLDASNCDVLFAGGTPLSGTLDPGLSIDHYQSAGCVCALEPDGTALCIARDSKESQLLLRFVPDAQEAEIAYRVEDDPLLLDFKGLVTGP